MRVRAWAKPAVLLRVFVELARRTRSRRTFLVFCLENSTMISHPSDTIQRLAANLRQVIVGDEQPVRWLLAALLAGGHVLLEDNPGTGKTTLAQALALSVQAEFKRLQFTADLLPSDISGVATFDPRDQQFHFHPGPVFTHILLADEINRASPRTQSALLEAMAEGQVTVEGERRALPDPFFVMATQNPVEFHGTYPLPEAQLDRFALSFGLGYVSAEKEVAMLAAQNSHHPLQDLSAVATLDAVRQLQQAVRQVRLGDAVRRYIVDLVQSTRQHPAIRLGASPRASLALQRLSQALALMDGLDFVTPDLVRELAVPTLAHRITPQPQALYAGQTGRVLVQALLQQLPFPQ